MFAYNPKITGNTGEIIKYRRFTGKRRFSLKAKWIHNIRKNMNKYLASNSVHQHKSKT